MRNNNYRSKHLRKPRRKKNKFESNQKNDSRTPTHFVPHRSKDRQPEAIPETSTLERFIENKFSDEILSKLIRESEIEIENLLAPVEQTLPKSPLPEPVPVLIPDRGFARAAALCQPPVPVEGKVEEEPLKNDNLDPWQKEALEYLLAGDNLIVDAPTSAGKTRIIERLIEARLTSGLKLIYTSPVKSLSNDKYREFSEKYGREKIGINTGDFKENLDAPIVLATLETYRNSLLGVEPRMDRCVVVYDEYHYLQDEGRGSAWEESIILTPPQSQLVLLSASVPNAEDFADWIFDLKQKKCKVIHVAKRPVPLVDVVFVKRGFILADKLNLQSRDFFSLKEIAKARRASVRRFLRFNPKERYLPLVKPVEDILKKSMVPLVVYAGRRADVENIAFILAKTIRIPPNKTHLAKLHQRIETLSGWEYIPPEVQRLIKKSGIAYHHSGLIPPGRVAIETLLKEGLLLICSGTMGISLGVNFAVRSALIADESRPGENGETIYSSTEIMQMLGRAGRRGCDKQGFSLWSDLCRYATQKPLGREKCKSSLKFDPTTVLGILGQHQSLAYLSEFYRKSFFMRGRSLDDVFVLDHDLISSFLYKNKENVRYICEDIPANYTFFLEKKKNKRAKCPKCAIKDECHVHAKKATLSPLAKVVAHLQKIEALEGTSPTRFGELARYFPQSGGFLIAKFIADGTLRAANLKDFIQVMGCFCTAHHKDVATTFQNSEFINDLQLEKLVQTYYPHELFSELYDENFQGELVFREFNPGGASIVEMWVNSETSWEKLVAMHESKNVSAGDIMMVLFRFATFLQSTSRLFDLEPELANAATLLRKQVLREPLDARNRMLGEEDG